MNMSVCRRRQQGTTAYMMLHIDREIFLPLRMCKYVFTIAHRLTGGIYSGLE